MYMTRYGMKIKSGTSVILNIIDKFKLKYKAFYVFLCFQCSCSIFESAKLFVCNWNCLTMCNFWEK